jgi:hypothetical protein
METPSVALTVRLDVPAAELPPDPLEEPLEGDEEILLRIRRVFTIPKWCYRAGPQGGQDHCEPLSSRG